MLFSTVQFLFYFLPIVLILYFIVPNRFRNLVLFIASLIFYAWGEPVYVVIMIFSTLLDYTIGRLIEKNDANEKKRKILLTISVVVNLGMLMVFKYTDFFIANFNQVFNTVIPLSKLPLPIGISFYTFQTMSYTIDVYKRNVKAQHDIIAFGTYVSLFPQLIAGPIVRYITVAGEINQRKTTVQQFSQGVQRFIQGLAKKVLLANNIGQIWAIIKAGEIAAMPMLTSWIGIICFAFQIYFDFSGYSDMAIGLGKMFGFNFDENFNYPYISKSITEFWRRWHISLSSWFKEYVYIPLGGNRHGLAKQVRNIIIVWLLTGFWHGAEWNFLLWGIYFGAILIIEKLFLLKWIEKLPRVIQHGYSILLILIGWVLFEFSSLNSVFAYIGRMFSFDFANLFNDQTIYVLLTNVVLFIVAIIACTPAMKWINEKLKASKFKYITIVVYLVLFFLCVAFLVDSTYNPFLYFRF